MLLEEGGKICSQIGWCRGDGAKEKLSNLSEMGQLPWGRNDPNSESVPGKSGWFSMLGNHQALESALYSDILHHLHYKKTISRLEMSSCW